MFAHLSPSTWRFGQAAPRLQRGLILAVALAAVAGCSRAGSKDGPKPVQVSPPAQAGELTEGAPAPAFSALAHSGERVSLEGLRGKVVVLYFYPKDGTPGCTTEAQEFRDQYPAFQAKNAVILGVSRDDNSSHEKFADDENLPFYLLPDTEGSLAAAYGVGSMFGFSKRVTFVIDRAGKIARIYPHVDPKTHADEVLQAIDKL
jgi:thioredoxin-dependent peroxiredoxin